MSRSLVPCSACHRHAWSTEPACPFCGGALGAPVVRRGPVAGRAPARLGRAGILLATTLAAGACGGSQSGAEPPDPPTDDGNMVALYGAPAEPIDAPPPDTDAVPEPEGDDDHGGAMAPKYGAPPPPP